LSVFVSGFHSGSSILRMALSLILASRAKRRTDHRLKRRYALIRSMTSEMLIGEYKSRYNAYLSSQIVGFIVITSSRLIANRAKLLE
jgi:hypothetical protein